VILLDENTPRSQREFLEARRLPVRKVALNWGREGMTDEEVVAQLHKMRQITLVTRDLRLYSPHLCHPRYCIAVIAAPADQMAAYVIQLAAAQRHPLLDPQQLGRVLCVMEMSQGASADRNQMEIPLLARRRRPGGAVLQPGAGTRPGGFRQGGFCRMSCRFTSDCTARGRSLRGSPQRKRNTRFQLG
jgi:hypothetical protein